MSLTWCGPLLAVLSVTTGLIATTPRSGPQVTEPHERICKCTDIAVAFTSEYSKGYQTQGNVSMISKVQAQPRTQHWQDQRGREDYSESR